MSSRLIRLILIVALFSACGTKGEERAIEQEGRNVFPSLPSVLADIYSGFYTLSIIEKEVVVHTILTENGEEDPDAESLEDNLRETVSDEPVMIVGIDPDEIDQYEFDPLAQSNLFYIDIFGSSTTDDVGEGYLDFLTSSINSEKLVILYQFEFDENFNETECAVIVTNEIRLYSDSVNADDRGCCCPDNPCEWEEDLQCDCNGVFSESWDEDDCSDSESTYADSVSSCAYDYGVDHVQWLMGYVIEGEEDACKNVNRIVFSATWAAEKISDDPCYPAEATETITSGEYDYYCDLYSDDLTDAVERLKPMTVIPF